jgi:hypothetical protein
MLQAYVLSVSDVSEVYCKLFQMDVAKVDRDVAYIAIIIHVCFKCMFQMFHWSRRTLQVFYLDVAKVDLNVAYTCMLQVYVLSIFMCFIHMFASVSYECWFSNVFKAFS